VTFVLVPVPSSEISISSPQEKIEGGTEAVIRRSNLLLISKEFDLRAFNTASYVSPSLASKIFDLETTKSPNCSRDLEDLNE